MEALARSPSVIARRLHRLVTDPAACDDSGPNFRDPSVCHAFLAAPGAAEAVADAIVASMRNAIRAMIAAGKPCGRPLDPMLYGPADKLSSAVTSAIGSCRCADEVLATTLSGRGLRDAYGPRRGRLAEWWNDDMANYSQRSASSCLFIWLGRVRVAPSRWSAERPCV